MRQSRSNAHLACICCSTRLRAVWLSKASPLALFTAAIRPSRLLSVLSLHCASTLKLCTDSGCLVATEHAVKLPLLAVPMLSRTCDIPVLCNSAQSVHVARPSGRVKGKQSAGYLPTIQDHNHVIQVLVAIFRTPAAGSTGLRELKLKFDLIQGVIYSCVEVRSIAQILRPHAHSCGSMLPSHKNHHHQIKGN